MRLDKHISEKHPDRSRTYIQKLIIDGNITVNNKIELKSGYNIKDTDKISVNFPEIKKLNIDAENIALNIVYEDENLIVINKAPNMVVHPSESGDNTKHSLVNALLFHCKDLSEIGGTQRPGIVHRLDKDTSGLIMVAKNDKTHRYLAKLIEDRKIEKIYIAIAHGKMATITGTIESPIGRSNTDRKKMSIQNQQKGKNAITHFIVKKYSEKLDISVLEIKIETGRTHQIRVHLSSIGHPIVFDTTYGNQNLDNLFAKKLNTPYTIHHTLYKKRQLLHAYKLSLILPGKNKQQTLKADLPKDMDEIISIK